MEKPSSLVKEETEKAIVEIINTSPLPPFVLELILKCILAEVHDVAVKQLESEKQYYESHDAPD